MAVPVIDATLSGAAANSYVTVAEAIAYFELRPGGKLWVDLDAEQQRGSLQFAATQIDREVYWGRKDAEAQALKFPRTGMTVIPEKVKHAQIEQALHLANGGFQKQMEFIDAQSSGVRESAAEGTRVRMVPFHSDTFASFQLSTIARQLLSGFIEAGVQLGRA